MQHDYNEKGLCLDCCIPSFLAHDSNNLTCPVRDRRIIKLLVHWWPLYEAGKSQIKDLEQYITCYFE